jgi:hypothetical protein
MLSGLIDKMRRASSSSASVDSMVGIIALMKAFVILEERPITLIVAGSWQYRLASYLRANYKIRTGPVGHFIWPVAHVLLVSLTIHRRRFTRKEQRNNNYNKSSWEVWAGQIGEPPAGCSKWHPSKAAGSGATEAYPRGYVAGRHTTENAAGGHFQHPA